MPSFFSLRAEDAAERFDPAVALLAVRGLGCALTSSQAHVLDVFLNQWVALALARAGDQADMNDTTVLELQQICELGPRRLPAAESFAAVYRNRWAAFRDLLVSKRRAIESRGVAPEPSLSQWKVIKPVLLANPQGISQSELADQLHLTPGRISQLMVRLEAQGYVRRVKDGQKSLVFLSSTVPTADRRSQGKLSSDVWGHALAYV
jgi:MarR family